MSIAQIIIVLAVGLLLSTALFYEIRRWLRLLSMAKVPSDEMMNDPYWRARAERIIEEWRRS